MKIQVQVNFRVCFTLILVYVLIETKCSILQSIWMIQYLVLQLIYLEMSLNIAFFIKYIMIYIYIIYMCVCVCHSNYRWRWWCSSSFTTFITTLWWDRYDLPIIVWNHMEIIDISLPCVRPLEWKFLSLLYIRT